MKIFIVLMMSASFLFCSVDAIWCYICAGELNKDECFKRIMDCSNSRDNSACSSSVSTFTYNGTNGANAYTGNMNVYTKLCSSSRDCSSRDYPFSSRSTTTSCCTTDLCNSASSYRISFWFLGFTAALTILIGSI